MSLRDEVARGYDALSRGDPYAFLDLYDADIELFVPAWVGPESGLFRGAEAVNRWYGNNFAQWTDQRWQVVETLEHGPSVVFVVHWTARGKRSGIGFDGRLLGVMSFVDGKIVSIVHLGGIGEATSPPAM
jgi:ketosteroid isomerase-like protein